MPSNACSVARCDQRTGRKWQASELWYGAGHVRFETIGISSGPAIFNLDILSIDPAESLKTFAKCAYVELLVRGS